MIITISGVPCSGKSSAIEIFKNKYGFESISTGEIYRKEAEKANMSVLEFNKNNRDMDIDHRIDNRSIEIGKNRIHEDIIFDSRMAWFFIPNSFKVFLTIPSEVMAKRLFDSNRDSNEKHGTIRDSERSLIERFNSENARYMKLYGVDNTNLKNYDLVIDNTDLTPEETAEIIFKEYQKYKKNKNPGV